MRHRLAAPLLAVLVLALAAFTGSALAGDGHGNDGSGNGNSANAPGQTKQAQAPATPTATQTTPPGQAKQLSKATTSTSTSTPTTADNSTGVKPSSTTAHGEHNTSAPASSNKTKLYGNGKTAGQIATQAGFGSATLYGPGNSQPHKAACPGSSHEVDVHALKNKASKCSTSQPVVVTPEVKTEESATCTTITRTVTERVLVSSQTKVRGKSGLHANAHAQAQRDQAQQVWQTVMKTLSVPTGANCASTQPTVVSTQVVSSPTVTPAAVVAPATVTAVTAPAAQAIAPATVSAPAVATPAPTGGVQGATVALKPAKTKPAGGVLGTTTRLGGSVASSRLPFTGFPLWIFALVAAGLIGTGLTMRRASANRI
jgi:hypothetical protein